MTPLKQQISLIPFSIEHWYSVYGGLHSLLQTKRL